MLLICNAATNCMTVSSNRMVWHVLMIWVTIPIPFCSSFELRVAQNFTTAYSFSTLCFSSQTPAMPRFNFFTSFSDYVSVSVVKLIMSSIFIYLAFSVLFFSHLIPCYVPFPPFCPLTQPCFSRQVLFYAFFSRRTLICGSFSATARF